MNNAVIDNYRKRHEQQLLEFVTNANIPAPQIKEAILYSLFPGGKRLRPILVYLCGEIVGVDINSLDLIAIAIEITHCYSLVHDDLPAMDNDDFRRNKPSCHRQFDEATAILVGDGLQALAIDLLASKLPATLTATKVVKIIQELTQAAGVSGMVSGQMLDLSELSRGSITEKQLREIHSLKTGAIFSACINMVLAASTANTVISETLQSLAKHLGLVFQMQDDYLDCYGAKDTLGKNRASDAANQKETFASLYNKSDLLELIYQQYQKINELILNIPTKLEALDYLINQLKMRTV